MFFGSPVRIPLNIASCQEGGEWGSERAALLARGGCKRRGEKNSARSESGSKCVVTRDSYPATGRFTTEGKKGGGICGGERKGGRGGNEATKFEDKRCTSNPHHPGWSKREGWNWKGRLGEGGGLVVSRKKRYWDHGGKPSVDLQI